MYDHESRLHHPVRVTEPVLGPARPDSGAQKEQMAPGAVPEEGTPQL